MRLGSWEVLLVCWLECASFDDGDCMEYWFLEKRHLMQSRTANVPLVKAVSLGLLRIQQSGRTDLS